MTQNPIKGTPIDNITPPIQLSESEEQNQLLKSRFTATKKLHSSTILETMTLLLSLSSSHKLFYPQKDTLSYWSRIISVLFFVAQSLMFLHNMLLILNVLLVLHEYRVVDAA